MLLSTLRLNFVWCNDLKETQEQSQLLLCPHYRSVLMSVVSFARIQPRGFPLPNSCKKTVTPSQAWFLLSAVGGLGGERSENWGAHSAHSREHGIGFLTFNPWPITLKSPLFLISDATNSRWSTETPMTSYHAKPRKFTYKHGQDPFPLYTRVTRLAAADSWQ